MHHHCLRCGHDWVARTDRPRACPQCKTYRWDQPIGKPLTETIGREEPASPIEREISAELSRDAKLASLRDAVTKVESGATADEIYGAPPTSLNDLHDNAPETPTIVLPTPPDPHVGETDYDLDFKEPA